MQTVLLNISAGNGPEECAYVAALTLATIRKELDDWKDSAIVMRLVETELSRVEGNIRSALIAIEGENAQTFADTWTGIIQWIWRSSYRPHHKRKNWFVSVKPYVEPSAGEAFSTDDTRFETAKARGPGGQHVNKTETAVRVIHLPTGKSAVAQGERSQLMNKKTAMLKLQTMFRKEQEEKKNSSRSELRHSHWELERGNPIRVYCGETLKLLKKITAKGKAK